MDDEFSQSVDAGEQPDVETKQWQTAQKENGTLLQGSFDNHHTFRPWAGAKYGASIELQEAWKRGVALRRAKSAHNVDYYGMLVKSDISSLDDNHCVPKCRILNAKRETVVFWLHVTQLEVWMPTFDWEHGYWLPGRNEWKVNANNVRVAIFPNGQWRNHKELEYSGYELVCHPDNILQTWIHEMDARVLQCLEENSSTVEIELTVSRMGRKALTGDILNKPSLDSNPVLTSASKLHVDSKSHNTDTEVVLLTHDPDQVQSNDGASDTFKSRKRKARSCRDGCHSRCISDESHELCWTNKEVHLLNFDEFVKQCCRQESNKNANVATTGRALRLKYEECWFPPMTFLSMRHFGQCCAVCFCKLTLTMSRCITVFTCCNNRARVHRNIWHNACHNGSMG